MEKRGRERGERRKERKEGKIDRLPTTLETPKEFYRKTFQEFLDLQLKDLCMSHERVKRLRIHGVKFYTVSVFNWLRKIFPSLSITYKIRHPVSRDIVNDLSYEHYTLVGICYVVTT